MTDQQLDELVARIGDEMLSRLGLSDEALPSAPAPPSCACAHDEAPAVSPRPANWSSTSLEWNCRDARATAAEVEKRCARALEEKLGAVSVLPSHVCSAVRTLHGSEVELVASVAWPHGGASTGAKALEAELALGQGAQEIETIMPTGALLGGEDDLIFGEMRLLADMAHRAGRTLTAVIETSGVDEARLVAACALARLAGADALSAAAGLTGHGAASGEAVRLFRRIAGDDLRVKAFGGVTAEAAALALVAAGADRVSVDELIEAGQS